jgi:YegS/Rv2252/BmrU family lipid kinase
MAAREVLVCVNRSSGGAARRQGEAEGIRAALARAGVSARVELVAGGGIAEHAQSAVAKKADLLIVGGGDGSVSAAAGVLGGTDTKLGILPLGTLNHFARDLGIPADLDGAAELIGRGTTRQVDIAEVNGRTFVNNSAIGLYPIMVIDRETQQRRLGRSKKVAMAVAAVRTLARFNRERLTLSAEDEKARLDTPLLFVGNNDYRIALPAPGTRDTLDDGKLCVMLLRRKTRLGFLLAAARGLIGRARVDDMVRLPPLERLKVESSRAWLPLSVDGEAVVMESPLLYRIRKRALSVIAPDPTT